ncbi:hypothetical protein FIV42_03765 [Persicimonas caeni]|uniref:Right-handed parallel beta-helix repeat-containing protein n=1 Tax=Persicimonas caeni TaxID=2292766 RepID=A0A4Y6PNJ1_PERCE|nr:hypothetical protein [Persicimonas caeni]QDG49888.1 hypothetical protein FIV42_03765 [Persicimonas caeni]QED31109.1 hypothetical protein FRD00_03760 [Persicimonas caeni]
MRAVKKSLLALSCAVITAGTACGPATDDDTNNGQLEPSADCSEAPELTPEMVNGGKTLAGGSCYRVNTRITVNDGTLTIEPGVVIEFAENAYMQVTADGRINAAGTADAPIFFTGVEQIRGHWRGVLVETNSTDNAFDHVVMEYGGGDNWSGAGNSLVMLRVVGKLKITNSTFRESANWALQAYKEADLSGFADNTFESNETPAWLSPDRVSDMAGTSEFVDNDNQYVQVSFSNGASITADGTWKDVGVPYRISDRTFINAEWTLDPGVTVENEEEVQILVNTDGGVIRALGEEGNPVTFRGVEALRGHWQGIEVASNTADNLFQHTVVEHGGGYLWSGDPSSYGALRVVGKMEIVDSTFRENANYALKAFEQSDLRGFANNTFENNDVPMWIAPDRVGEMAGTSQFTGNDEQIVKVSHTNGASVSTDQSWKDVGVPYRVVDRTFVNAALTIEAGVTVEFGEEDELHVEEEGSLIVAGTADNPVLITGVNKVEGYWHGIGFKSNSTANSISHATIEYGGSNAWSGNTNNQSTIFLAKGTLDLESTAINYSEGHGIYIADGAAISSCEGVTFDGNVKENVFNDSSPEAACNLI